MNHRMNLAKLIGKIQDLSHRLEMKQEFIIHRNINHFYYMQKEAELNELREQFEETQEELSWLALRIEKEYGCIFKQWSRDVRWLQHYEMTSRN